MLVFRSRARVLAGALLTAAVAAGAPSRAVAQTAIPVDNSWQQFLFFLGAGQPVDGAPFTFSTASPVTVSLTDDGVTGDAFDVFVNGASTPAFATPTVAGGIDTSILDPNVAFTDARLSHGTFDLGPGSYVLQVVLRDEAPGYTTGEGFIRVASVASVVPEPDTRALATGGAVLLYLWRSARRRRGATS
ncbi:MAG TPA: hypothetical protein VGD56_19605 [Gemmatirosa sp.]